MVKVQPTTDHDGVAAAAPSDLAEAAGRRPQHAHKEHESDGTDKAPSRQSLVLKGHTNDVNCLAALAGGRLASGSDDKSIIIWNLADGSELAKLEGHTKKRSDAWPRSTVIGSRLVVMTNPSSSGTSRTIGARQARGAHGLGHEPSRARQRPARVG